MVKELIFFFVFVNHSYGLCPLSQNTAAAAVWTCGSLGQTALCPARYKQTWPPLTASFVYEDNADIVTLGGSNIGLHSLKSWMMKSDLVKQVPGRWGGGAAANNGSSLPSRRGLQARQFVLLQWKSELGDQSQDTARGRRGCRKSLLSPQFIVDWQKSTGIASRILKLNLTTRVCAISKSSSLQHQTKSTWTLISCSNKFQRKVIFISIINVHEIKTWQYAFGRRTDVDYCFLECDATYEGEPKSNVHYACAPHF